MFTITTGVTSHFIFIPGVVYDTTRRPFTAMVEVLVGRGTYANKYTFRSLLCDGTSSLELITQDQLVARGLGDQTAEQQEAAGLLVYDGRRGPYHPQAQVITWAVARCSQVSSQLHALLSLGIFDLPETS